MAHRALNIREWFLTFLLTNRSRTPPRSLALQALASPLPSAHGHNPQPAVSSLTASMTFGRTANTRRCWSTWQSTVASWWRPSASPSTPRTTTAWPWGPAGPLWGSTTFAWSTTTGRNMWQVPGNLLPLTLIARPSSLWGFFFSFFDFLK